MAKRDDFSERTKRTLAVRAAHFCSNPHCLKLTAGPHSDPSKSLSTGHAAHIHAASSKGPRYDVTQTPAQRKSIANGLWLCRECGDIVDKDNAPHTPELLRRWKTDHEAMIAEFARKVMHRVLRFFNLDDKSQHWPKRLSAHWKIDERSGKHLTLSFRIVFAYPLITYGHALWICVPNCHKEAHLIKSFFRLLKLFTFFLMPLRLPTLAV
jgi:hypothetical protein